MRHHYNIALPILLQNRVYGSGKAIPRLRGSLVPPYQRLRVSEELSRGQAELGFRTKWCPGAVVFVEVVVNASVHVHPFGNDPGSFDGLWFLAGYDDTGRVFPQPLCQCGAIPAAFVGETPSVGW